MTKEQRDNNFEKSRVKEAAKESSRLRHNPPELVIPKEFLPRPWLSKADVAIFVFVVMACLSVYFWMVRS